MIEKRYDTLGKLNAPILVYDTIEAAEAVQKGALLEAANDNWYYRGVAPAVRDLVCELVEASTSIVRKSEVIGKTKAGKDIVQWETEGAYTKRVMAEKGWDDLTAFQTILDESCRAYKEKDDETGKESVSPLAVDAKGREYAPRQLKLAKVYKLAAAKALHNSTFSRLNDKLFKHMVDADGVRLKAGEDFHPTGDMEKVFEGTFAQKNEDGTETQITFKVSDKDAEALGWKLKAYWQYEEAKKQQGVSALLD